MKKIFILMLFILTFALVGCNLIPFQDTTDYGLKSVNSEENLRKLIEDSKSYEGRWWNDSAGGVIAEIESDNGLKGDYSSTDYTKTNVQVEGVDEGDIIKTDGSRIYSVSYNRLQVVKLLGEGKMEVLLNEELESVIEDNYHTYTHYSEIYVTDDYLVVIGQKYGYSIMYYGLDEKLEAKYPSYYNYTQMSTIDIYDIDTLEQIDSYEVSGYLQGSRLIYNNLYIMSSHYVYYYSDYNYDIRPWYKHNDEIKVYPYEEIKYIPDTTYQAFTVISNIKLEKEIKFDSDVFLSFYSWGQIYVSKNAIYFASNYYLKNLLGFYEQKGIIISYQFSNKGDVFFGGYGTYDGYIINQFAIDEYDGYLRIATTDNWGINIKNRLYIFKRVLKNESYTLEQVSLLDKGLGKPGERIQSVRFNEEKATVVTFLQTDPFYIIDLSDPYKPVITGELEIPGFSTYQHPWGDTIILGIGFNADDNGRTTGLKLALYDISDEENPTEVGMPYIIGNENGWVYSEATYNHKALMVDKSRNSFGFALNNYYSSKPVSEYLLFTVDETSDQPIELKYRISHEKYIDLNLSKTIWYWTYYDYFINRAFRVDDYLYVVSNEVITSHYLLGNDEVVDAIIFRNYYNTK